MENIKKFQEFLAIKDLDAYIITSNDNHFSEYISDHYKIIEFLSGFSGENATLVITENEACLWVDGRFFLQADLEVNEAITVMKMGEHNVPTVIEYIEKHINESGNLGFDGKLTSKDFIESIKSKLNKVNLISTDFINEIWKDRPDRPFSLVYILEDFFSGKSFQDKLQDVRVKLAERNANTLILSQLEDQAWLFNMRGNDIECTPVFMAFTVITPKDVHIFINIKKINDEVKKYLNDNNVEIHEYDDFYSYIAEIKSSSILIDPDTTSYAIYRSIYSNNTVIEASNPTAYLKAIKNNIEILNTKQAHIKDGVALVKSLYYLYNHANELTEITYADYLEEKRREQKGFIELSFPTIAGFKDHGAIVHYVAASGSEHKLNNEEKTFFLCDSGAHYAEGTTDITRTYALGPVSDEMKLHYTSVLKSHIALASATFMKGCTGTSLDILARNPLWRIGLNFNHGTGHGVGHILSVHEGPQRISYSSKNNVPIEPGMVTTDEPGLYLEKKYGIRIENELLCVEAFNNEFGHFYKFEALTVCPIDTKAINTDLLTYEEKDWLNTYHKNVYNTLYPYLSSEEQQFLLDITQDI